MNTTRTVLGIAAGISVAASAAGSGPLNTRIVPADAKAVVHLDLEAAVESHIGRFILENSEKFDLDQLEQVEQQFGLNPIEDIYDVTIYTMGNEDGVLVATVSDRIEQALETVADMLGDDRFRTRSIDGTRVYVIDTEDGTVYAYVEPTGRRRSVVLSKDADLLMFAVALVGGEGESLRDSDSPLAGATPADGAFLFLATMDPDRFGRGRLGSELLREVSLIVAQVGEDDGEAFAEASIDMNSSEDAARAATLGKGLVAAGQFIARNEDKPAAVRDARMKFLSALVFEADDERVGVAFRYNVEDFVRLLENAR